MHSDFICRIYVICVCSWIVVSNRPWLYEQNVGVLQETKTVYPLRAHGSIPIFDEVRVAHLFPPCVMSALCCHCLWIVYSWLSLRFSLSTIINNFYLNRTCFRRSFHFKKSGFIIRCLQWFKVFVSFVIFIMTEHLNLIYGFWLTHRYLQTIPLQICLSTTPLHGRESNLNIDKNYKKLKSDQ